jgi:sulfate adenylyltransferase
MVKPHGGTLVNRIATDNERDVLLKEADSLPSVTLSDWSLSDLELIANGAFSPLEGFMNQNDYLHVLKEMKLANGIVWSIPITLPVSKQISNGLEIRQDIALKGSDDVIYGILTLEEKFEYNKDVEALFIYKTLDKNHPGVRKTYEKEDVYLAGPITLLNRPLKQFNKFQYDPKSLRSLFKKRGWNRIAAFQTRNPIHRAHEYLQKTALEMTDGLLIHPLVGETKKDDIPAKLRFESYQVLLEKYYPEERVQLSVYPAAMRYAGPREAVFHALVRKNYGCTHFIVGRDHAGVGNYYGTYESQEIFEQFSPEEIGIEILKFDHAFYCKICENMATAKTCPHSSDAHLHLSGTKVRSMLRKGEVPPKEFSRPEVIDVLIKGMHFDEK